MSNSNDMVLGDLFYEAKGRITNQRVLDIEGPTIETTVSYDGTMKSSGSRVEVRHIATFTSSMRDGAFLSEGTGVITAKDASGEMATELGRGITRFVEGGKKVVGRGLFIFSNTSSKTGNLGFLNNLTGVLEYEADEAGNSTLKVWEWK
ncbi:MAG TPA: hypothetical protein VE544_13795 [Nitrososphaeraceae archaeon]|nr:hypothetical protein [Nitrososphaeraceae archaeon]